MKSAVPLHLQRQRKIYDFILHELKHQIGCPKWGRTNKPCECGLDEIRELVREEIAVLLHSQTKHCHKCDNHFVGQEKCPVCYGLTGEEVFVSKP